MFRKGVSPFHLVVLFHCAVLQIAALAHGDTVHLRGASSPIDCNILNGTIEGLRYEIVGEASTKVIPWSGIKKIDFSESSPNLELLLEQGDALWRAKQRMLRGDIWLAEPTFKLLFQEYEGSQGEDACLVAEGLLRCALSRGDVVLAFQPWMETLRHYEQGEESPFPLPPIIDPSTSLCFHLPPVELVRDDFLEAIQGQLLISEDAPNDLFLSHILSASQGNIASMQSLEDSLGQMPQWKQIWAHYFLAEGYLDDGRSSKDRTVGLLHLAKIASLPTNLQPWLSGAALLRLAREFRKDGAQAIADRMMNEMQRNYPSHPLLSSAMSITRNAVR